MNSQAINIKKTISLTLSGNIFSPELFNVFKYSPIRVTEVLKKQGDFYFGEGNWYATNIYVQNNKNKVTYLMDIVGLKRSLWDENTSSN